MHRDSWAEIYNVIREIPGLSINISATPGSVLITYTKN